MNYLRNKLAELWASSAGRITVAAVSVVALVAASALIAVGVIPAGAGAGEATTLVGVQPEEVDLGGQPDDCSASEGTLPSAASEPELRITNPTSTTYTTAVPGATISLTVVDDELLDFTATGGIVVYDVIIKGGSKSTHFDYDDGPGAVTSDEGLHAPTRGGSSRLYSISHVSFCYEAAVALSGTVLFDANDDTDLVADLPEGGRVVRAYSGTQAIASATSEDGSGAYTLLVPPNTADVLVCEDVNAEFVQLDSALYTGDCSGITGSEPGGYLEDVGTSPVSGLDFFNAEVSCGEDELLEVGGIFSADFALFGNSVQPCVGKAGDLVLADGIVKLPIVGTGSIAGFGKIDKTFTDPSSFVPLTWSREDDGTFVDLEWCSLRAKVSPDGDEFNDYLADDATYPSLAGVTYVGEPNLACKVYEAETLEGVAPTVGVQTTVVYFEDDPYFG